MGGGGGGGDFTRVIQYSAVEVTEILSAKLARFLILTDVIYYVNDAVSRKLLRVNNFKFSL